MERAKSEAEVEAAEENLKVEHQTKITNWIMSGRF
jgi:hypothetical protein